MSVIVPINIIVPVYASAADVADNNSSVYIGNGYVVYYDIKSSWGNNQNIEIKSKIYDLIDILNRYLSRL